jgi:segregation and condensation protein A
MRSLSIDIASEYLVMAATLVHIKSKMLLPSVPAGQEDDSVLGEDEEDPRAELVRRLLEYQKYKAAAAELGERGTLGKDVFPRGLAEPVPEGPAPFAPTGVFSLLDAFEKVLKRTKVKLDHEVVFDRISITDRIVELTEKLSERRTMRFEDLVLSTPDGSLPTRFDVVITFLAVLEMARLKLLKVYQAGPLEPIHLQYGDGPPPNFDEEEEEVAEAKAAAESEAVAEAAAPEVPEGEVAAESAVPEAQEGDVAVESAVPEAPEGEIAVESAVPEAPEGEVAAESAVPEGPEGEVEVESAASEVPGGEVGAENAVPEGPVSEVAEEPAAPERLVSEVAEEPATPDLDEALADLLAAREQQPTTPTNAEDPPTGEPDGG